MLWLCIGSRSRNAIHVPEGALHGSDGGDWQRVDSGLRWRGRGVARCIRFSCVTVFAMQWGEQDERRADKHSTGPVRQACALQ